MQDGDRSRLPTEGFKSRVSDPSAPLSRPLAPSHKGKLAAVRDGVMVRSPE